MQINTYDEFIESLAIIENILFMRIYYIKIDYNLFILHHFGRQSLFLIVNLLPIYLCVLILLITLFQLFFSH